MPGKLDPIGGIGGLAAAIDELRRRIAGLEAWQRAASGIVAPGVIAQWGGASAPAGALLCDGSTFDPAVYPRLFAVLGSTTLPNIATTPITVIWT